MSTDWQPKHSREDIDNLITEYRLRPYQFDGKDDDIQTLEDHAAHYAIPFARTKEHQDSFLFKTIKQFGSGWWEGFTTLPPEKLGVGSEPRDTAEGIARNLGHLAGFVGYMPGARILKALGAVKLAGTLRGIKGKSVPMKAADMASRKVSKVAQPFLKDLPNFITEGGVLRDMASGAFHLGVASGVSSWTHGVDEVFHSAGFGAVAGGAFRGIGNLPGFGKRLSADQLKPNGSPNLKKLEPGQIADLTARTMAGAAFTGLPATAQNATTEEQVYAYALGAFFGFKETPYQTRASRQFLNESFKGNHGPAPELNPKWDTLTPEMQGIVKNDFKHFFGPEESQYVVYDLMRGKGIDIKDIDKLAKEYQGKTDIDTNTGEVSFGLNKEDLKSYRDAYKDDPRFEDPHDLDMHIAKLGDIPGRVAGRGGYVEQNLKEAWETSKNPDIKKIKVADEIYSEWTKHHKDGKPTLGAEEKITKFIEKKYGVTLNEEQSGWWRRWAESTRKKEWVDQISLVDGKVGILKGKTNAVGNKKDLSQERLVVEDRYDAEHVSVFKEPPRPEEGFFRVLDHMIWGNKEYDLTRVHEGLARDELIRIKKSKSDKYQDFTPTELKNIARSEARIKIDKAYNRLMDSMWKQGYYYMGGKGDNKKMYFVRKHPRVAAKPKESKKVLNSIQRAMRKNGIKGVKKNYRAGLEKFKERYPNLKNAADRYRQMYVSNVLYDMTFNGFSSGTKPKEIELNMGKVLAKGMINNAKAYNKRAQIWFNTGLSANPNFVFTYLKDRGVNVIGGRNYRVGFFKDADGYYDQKKITLKSKADEYTEMTDGAIIAREEIIDAHNVDKGLPTSGNVNKSFIVAPNAEYGAVLGKYMMHAPSAELAKYMKENDLHMLIPESAAKQMGTRQSGDLFIDNKGKIGFNGEGYELPISSFRTIMSEITSDKYIKPQRLPKQMFTTLSSYGYKDVKPEVIQDMYETLSNRAFKGIPEANEMLKAYKDDPSNANLNRAINNLEDISIPKLLEMMRDPKHEKFASKAYEKILKLNNEYVEALAEEGELSRSEIQQEREVNAEFESIVQRLNRVFPEGSIGAYLHKFSRDYRMAAMRNYVVTQLTRPRMYNSATARMRPWDIGMRMKDSDISRLRDTDDIFYLDEGFKKLRIKDPLIIKGRETLENVWEDFNAGKYKANKDKVAQILHAAAMRVPMDSISGAHSLKFAGFTGVKGYGVLLHPRTMKALGGADLDGDKAFIFFGGDKSGFKQSWREMYHSQKDEYVDSKTNAEKHNKEAIDPKTGQTYGEQLAVRSKEIQQEGLHPGSQYSPYWRGFMSEGAASGRDMLGFAVTNRAAVIGAYNAIRGHTGENVAMKDIILEVKGSEVRNKNGEVATGTVWLGRGQYSIPFIMGNRRYRIVFKAKTGEEDLQRFREMARATVALGSDPMDEAGLKGIDVFSSKVLDTLFNYEIRSIKGKVSKPNPSLTKKLQDGKLDWLKGKGLHRMFFRTNSLLYGKNYTEARRWSYADISAGLEAMKFLPEGSRNTLMPLLSESLRDVNWSDNLFRHTDYKRVKALYDTHQNMTEREDWLNDILGRTTLAAPWNKFIDRIYSNRLYTREGLETIARDEEAFRRLLNETYVHKPTGEERLVMGNIDGKWRPINYGSYDYRRGYLEKLVLQGEDFLVNDMSTMASLKSITDIVGKHGIVPERISKIHADANEIKNMGVHMARRRRDRDDTLKDSAFTQNEEASKVNEMMRENFGIEDTGTAKLDQIQIDSAIRTVKKGYQSNAEKDLFDILLMGTYQRGYPKAVQEMKMRLEKKKGKKAADWKVVDMLEKQVQNTSLVRSAMNSKAVKDSNLKKFFSDYDALLSKTKTDLSKEEQELIIGEYKGREKIKSVKDDEGNLIKGEIIESSDLSEKDRTYLDDIAPFVGVNRGKVKDPELREIYHSLKGHLEHYHNLDTRNLNGLFRGLFGKNINQATKYDLKTLDRYFNEMRDGTWFKKTVDWMLGKDKGPKIRRAYYWMFPKAVDRDLMRHPGMVQWVEDVGPYKDRLGNTISGRTVRPTSTLGEIQQWAYKHQELSMQKNEEEKERFREKLNPFIRAVEDGDVLYDIAVAMRERRIIPRVLRRKYKDNNHKLTMQEMSYESHWNEVKDSYERLKGKTYRVPMEGGTRLMSGDEIIRSINDILTKQNEATYKWMRGDPDYVESWLAKGRTKDGRENFQSLQKLRKEFYAYITKKAKNNEQIPIEKFGIDGLRQITKRILLSMTPRKLMTAEEWAKVSKKLEITPFDVTGEFPSDIYYPHVSFDRKKVDIRLRGAIKNLFSDPNYTKEEKQAEARKIFYHYKQLTGDFMARDEMTDNFDVVQKVMKEYASGRSNKAKNILMSDLKKVGNQFSRSAHIGGWSRDPEAYESYMKNSVDTFYKQAMQLASRITMNNFNERFYKQTKDAKLTNDWTNFFKLYTQSAMGYPTQIPEKVMNDPRMKIKGTPYKWLADSQAKKRIDYIRKRLGIGRKRLEEWDLDQTTIDELSGVEYSQMQGWGSLEAKWQLASLLAHPKSSIANLYGGTVHTWISAGYGNLRKGRNFDYLKTNINPKWESMKDVERWIQKQGVIEEFLIYEAGLNPKIKSKKFESFLREATAKIKKDPDFSDTSLNALRKKHGVTDSIWNFAASFMRIPERMLRRDAFMAHYLQAREQFGGAIKDFDNPFLIEMAKRGVKGTQFLYSSPFRPMWANSTLGRVFSRFQLWSWNSVRFRNDTIRQAHIYGWEPGTKEFERYKRMAQADLFMMSLSSLFMYSLFENALPAPYNWFQDTADFLMGDEKEKERAFYGSIIGPFQAVTPPALRLLPPMFKWLVTGDSDKLTGYYLWTMPPFGRLIRDVVGPGGAIENPYYAITKFTGLPVMQFSKMVKDDPATHLGGRFLY